MKLLSIVSGFVLCGMATVSFGREWLSLDGRKLDADFISTQNDQVTLKRTSDGQTFSIPLNKLSEADRNWVKQQKPAKPAAAAKPIEGPFAKLITGAWENSEFEGLKFSFYGGKDLTAAEKIPLVLTLHGKSKNEEIGKQVGGWMKSFAKPENYAERPCFIVAPLSAQPEAGQGMGWNEKQAEQVIKLVKALIKGLPIEPKRVYIAGHSMGGFGTCHIMARDARLFAAAIPVSGSSTGDVAALARKPMWLFHATDDQTVPVSGAREFAKLMKMSKQFKYTELPEGGHGIPGKVFDDPETQKWLFEQRLK